MNGDRGFGAATVWRVGGIGELCRAVEIGRRCKGDVARGGERHSAVGSTKHFAHNHAVTIRIIGEQTLRPNGKELVLNHGEARVIQRHRNRTHAHINCCSSQPIAAI